MVLSPTLPNVVKMRDLRLAIEARCQSAPVLSEKDVQAIKKTINGSLIKGKKARQQHDAKAMLSAEATKHRSETMAKLEERAKSAPLLYFGEKIVERELSPEEKALTDAGAFLTIRGKRASIEDIFEDAKRDSNGDPVPKGANFDHFICPYTGDKFPAIEAKDLYQGLWSSYLKRNPTLVEYLREHINNRPGLTFRCQKLLSAYNTDKDSFIAQARDTNWYRNIEKKLYRQNEGNQPLSAQISVAERRQSQPSHKYDTSRSYIR